jgi:sec-independent protein translocase protein TatB
MFDIGFWELALIGVLALVVLGPKRLPEAARTAGRWVGRLRAFIANVQQDLDRQMGSGELEELRQLKEELNQTRQMIEQSSQSVYQGIENLAGDEPATASATRGRLVEKKPKTKKAKKKVGKKKARSTSAKKSSKKTTARKSAKKKAAGRSARKSK